jgi:hypothetical protein
MHARAMDENVIVTTFSGDSRAYGAPARLQAKLRKLRERLQHLVHH